jgi:CBS domain-containing protein
MTLGVPACAVFGHSDPSELSQAHNVLSQISERLPQLETRTVEAPSPAAMLSTLPTTALLIVGAPGGSWFQRRFFGPGARIQAKAQGGTIVVNHSPPRVYQVMQPPIAFGPKMRVADALELSEGLDVMVADRGKLLGRACIGTLRSVRPELEVHQVMDKSVLLSVADKISEAIDLVAHYGDGLVPVVDDKSYLVGCVSVADLSASKAL